MRKFSPFIAVLLLCAGLFCLAQAQVSLTGAGLGTPATSGCSGIVDDSSAKGLAAVSAGSFSYTVGTGTFRALLLYIVQSSGTVTGSSITATYNGNSLTSVFNDGDSAFLGLVGSGVTSGSNSVSYTWTGGGKADVYVLSVSCANQTGGTTTFYNSATNNATSGTSSVSVSAATGDRVMAGYLNATSPATTNYTSPGNGTDIGNNTSLAGTASNATAANWANGSATVAMSYNMSASTFWIGDGIAIKQH